MVRRRLVVAVLAAAVAFSGCGSVVTARDAVGGLVIADVERAREIAFQAGDAAGVECADAILEHLAPLAAAEQTPIGVFSSFMKGREVRRRLGGGIDEEIHRRCASLVLDAEQTLLKLGLIGVPGGSAVRGLLAR